MSDANEFFGRWVPGIETYNDEMRELSEQIRLFCFGFYLNEPGTPHLLMLSGESGTGKTCCARGIHKYASAVAMSAWENGNYSSTKIPEISFVHWPSYIEDMNHHLENEMRRSALTVIDDVGAETDRFKNDFPSDKFCQLLGAREGRWTFITSNLFQEHWAVKDSRIGNRLLRKSRLIELRNTKSWAEAQNTI